MAEPSEWKTIGVVGKSRAVDRTEKQWSRDMPAYKRLRADGLQPRGIDGCGDLETRATDRLEVEMGHVFKDRATLEQAKEGMDLARDVKDGLA